MGIEYFDFSIATGASRQIDCRADFVRYMAGSAGGADESIIIKSAQGGIEVKLKPGQSFKIDTPQVRWFVQGVSGNTVIGEILFSEGGDFYDASVAGVVSVVDGSKNRVKAGESFTAAIYQGASAGNYSAVQLWNPTGSGKNAYVQKLETNSATTASLQTMFSNAQLTNLAGATNQPQNKKPSGPASVIQSRAVAAAAIPAVIGAYFSFWKSIANQKSDILSADPICIEPGYGLNVFSADMLNADVAAAFQFIEEKI